MKFESGEAFSLELEKENQRLKRAVADLTVDNMILKEASKGNWLIAPSGGGAVWCGIQPAARGELRGRACEVLGQARSTQRRSRKRGASEAALLSGRGQGGGSVRSLRVPDGYRDVRAEGWVVNHKRVERMLERGGLVESAQETSPNGARALVDRSGSCIRLRPLYQPSRLGV